MKSGYDGAIYTEKNGQSKEKKWHQYLKWGHDYDGSGLKFSSERYRELSNFGRSSYRVSYKILA
jgi:hypothetical protein